MRTLRSGLPYVLAALAVVAASCAGAQDPATAPSTEVAGSELDDERAGSPVTDRPFQMFTGEEASLTTTYAGEKLVVNFWASWCPPCIEEMPDIERIHQDLDDQITIVGLNLRDAREEAEAIADQTGVTYDLAEDPDGALYVDFGGFAMPTTYFVDEHGMVVGKHAGIASEQQLRDLINEHLLD